MFRIEANGNATYGLTSKYLFQSGILDMTLVNYSLSTDETIGIPIECDIYEITAGSMQQDASSLIGAFQGSFTDTPNEGAAATGLAETQRGVTPWDCPEALSRYRIKIWKKTKYFLTSGGWTTYQIRDPKRHAFSAANMRDWDSSQGPATRWLLVVAKPLPGSLVGQVFVSIGVTRKYLYKVDQSAPDGDAFNP